MYKQNTNNTHNRNTNTRTHTQTHTCSPLEKLARIQVPKIVLKIMFKERVPISVNAMKLKCLIRRLVNAVLPPPGGPITPVIMTSMIVRTSNVLRSYLCVCACVYVYMYVDM